MHVVTRLAFTHRLRCSPTRGRSSVRCLQFQPLEPRCLLASVAPDSSWVEQVPLVGEYCEALSQSYPLYPTATEVASAVRQGGDLAYANGGPMPEGEGDDPNQLPVAEEDGYATSVDEMLKVDGPGVLANDIDADGDALHAVLVRSTQHGTLSFQANGAFTYTPNPSFNRDDTFEYRPNDGMADGNVVTVTINVRTPYPWHNGILHLDVNDDGSISPIDALQGINSLNRLGSRLLPDVRDRPLKNPFYDTSGNGFFTPIDVLLVINYLNRRGLGEGEMSVPFDAMTSLLPGRLPDDSFGASPAKVAHDGHDQTRLGGEVGAAMPWSAHFEIGCEAQCTIHPSEVTVAQPLDVTLIALEEVLASIAEDVNSLAVDD